MLFAVYHKMPYWRGVTRIPANTFAAMEKRCSIKGFDGLLINIDDYLLNHVASLYLGSTPQALYQNNLLWSSEALGSLARSRKSYHHGILQALSHGAMLYITACWLISMPA